MQTLSMEEIRKSFVAYYESVDLKLVLGNTNETIKSKVNNYYDLQEKLNWIYKVKVKNFWKMLKANVTISVEKFVN